VIVEKYGIPLGCRSFCYDYLNANYPNNTTVRSIMSLSVCSIKVVDQNFAVLCELAV